MRLHRRMLSTGYTIGLLNDYIGMRETLVDIAVTNAETMTDIGIRLRTYAKVSGIVVGDVVLIVNEKRAFRGSLDRIKNGGEFFIFHIDQIEGLAGLFARRSGDGGYRVAHVARTIKWEDGLIFNLATILPQFTYIIGSEHHNTIGQRRRIDAHNSGMRIGRTEDTCMEHP